MSQSQIAKCPKCDHEMLYKGTALRPRVTCEKCHHRYYLARSSDQNTNSTQKKQPKKDSSNTQDLAHLGRIIDTVENPVAFATAHIFDQMIETKDVRWAQLYVQVLDKTNKLDYETIKEQEWENQAKSLPMEELVQRVAKKESISRSTLRRLEKVDDTSPYDNF